MTNPNLPALRPDYQMMAPMDEGPPPGSPVRIRKFLIFLRKLWWVPLLTLAISAGGLFAYLRWAPPSFVSKASMWETEKLQLPGGAAFSEDAQNHMGTQIELLRNGALERLALARLAASGTNAIPKDSDGKPIAPKLAIAQVPKSTIFIIEATSSNPVFAEAYLNALLNEYMEYKKHVRKTVSGDTLASISEQVLRLERDLKNEQDALTAFQQTNNLAILQEEGTIAGGYLAKLDTQLSDYKLELQLLAATALEQEANATRGTPVSTVAPTALQSQNSGSSSAGNPERQNAAREIELLKLQREKLSHFLRPKHPKIVRLDSDIERAQKLNDMFRAQNGEQLASARAATQLRIDGVQSSVKEWRVKVMNANARIAEAERLKLNVNRTQVLYDRLVSLLQNVDISRNIDQETLSILEPASTAVRSYKEEKSNAKLALFGGLFAGLAIIFLIAVRDDRFTSLSEVNEKFGDVIVGQVPEVPRIRGKVALPLLQIEDDRPMYAESYRNLRSALFFMPADGERPKLLLITSAMPSEGKSTIAANLARTLALGGSRVLLIDADLRRGYLHELMEMRREPGLSELLQRPEDLDKIIQTNCLPNLTFISRGGHASNPGDLFLGVALDRLLVQLRQRFDYVLIDTSPVFAADDATTLAPKVDGTLFVVRSRFSRAGPVREALELLGQRQARVLGLVVNGADASSHSYYYYKNTEYYQTAKSTGPVG